MGSNAVFNQNIDEALSTFTSDGIFMIPHLPPAKKGHAAIKEDLTNFFAVAKCSGEVSVVEITEIGTEWAVVHAVENEKLKILATRQEVETNDQGLVILTRRDGVWKVTHMVFNPTNPAPFE